MVLLAMVDLVEMVDLQHVMVVCLIMVIRVATLAAAEEALLTGQAVLSRTVEEVLGAV